MILEEIGMYEDTPEDLVAERLSAAVYKGSPLARPILGTQATLAAMTGEWLAAVAAGALPPRSSGGLPGGQLYPGAGGPRWRDCLSALEPGPAGPDKPLPPTAPRSRPGKRPLSKTI